MPKSQKKSVIIFATAYYPHMSGAEIALKEITQRLDGYVFDLITARLSPGLDSEENYGNIRIHRVGFGKRLDVFVLPLFGFFKFLQLKSKKQYAFAWSLMASQASILAVMVAKLFRLPLYLTLQEGDEEDYLKRYTFGVSFLFPVILWFHRLVIRRADHIQVISHYLKKRAKIAGAKASIEVIPNAVATDIFQPMPIDENLRVQLKIPQQAKIIITTGRLVQKNGVSDLLAGLALLPPEYMLVSVGGGDDLEKLKKQADEMQITARVRWVSSVAQAELPRYLSLARVFCRPSRSEGLGNSFLEAMACGIPVIAPPVGGIVDFLVDGATGLFCQVQDPGSIADAVLRLESDLELREKIITSASKLIAMQYTWEQVASRMQKSFDSFEV